MTYRSIAILAACAWPLAAQAAAPAVKTDSAVYVERSDAGTGRQLEITDSFGKGDRVVTILRWERRAGSGGFTITNPMPRSIAFEDSSRGDAEVSVDGGRTWGRLGELTMGGRLASPEDVTHVRWRIPAQTAMRGRGQIAYSGIVR